MKFVSLEVLKEVNDHDGYCSGNENEYSKRTIKIKVDLPSDLRFLAVGSYIDDYDWSYQLKPIYDRFDKTIEDRFNQSYYCDPGDGYEHHMESHSIRLTVVSAKVVN